MTAAGPADRQPAFRELLCLLATGVSVASMVELALIAHWHGGTQTLAWVAAWAGLTAAWLVSGPTGPRRLRAGVGLAAGAATIGVVGVFVHLNQNLAFVNELHPDEGALTRLLDAAQGGLPLLAPGSLALPGVLVTLAAWRHPDVAVAADDVAEAREGTMAGAGAGVFDRERPDQPDRPEWPEWPGPGRWGNLVATTAATAVKEREHHGLPADRGGGPGADPADHPEPAGEAERLDPADEP